MRFLDTEMPAGEGKPPEGKRHQPISLDNNSIIAYFCVVRATAQRETVATTGSVFDRDSGARVFRHEPLRRPADCRHRQGFTPPQ